VQSTGAGQLSSEAYRTSVTTAGILQVKYLAPPRHCSSVRIHFLGDGKEEALSAEIPPGASSGYTDLGPVTGGVHEVALQAEGVSGGCNTGRLSSWQGSMSVWTSSSESLQVADGLGPAVFEANFVNFARGYVNRGCYISADGGVYAYRYERSDPPWVAHADAEGRYAEADLLEKFSHNRKALGNTAAAEVGRKSKALAIIRAGQIAESPPQGADRGETYLVGYLRQGGTDRFLPVLLGQSGDVVRVNLAAGAEELTKWLREIAERNHCL
jgi:hypothetical protein